MPKKNTPNSVDSVPAPGSASSPAAKKRPAASKTTARKTGAKKKPSSGASKRPAPKTPAKPATVEPSEADIRLRAYFIAERRLQLGIPGDSADDWLDARRQLMEEASR